MHRPFSPWELIQNTTPASGAGSELHAARIQAALEQRPLENIIAFDKFLHARMLEAYRWDLWTVAYIAFGGCGDDGFEYFGAWLVAQGESYFERALTNPASAVDRIEPGTEEETGWCESLLYVADRAYEARSGGREMPLRKGEPRRFDSDPKGKRWTPERLPQLYPELVQRFRRR